MESFTTYPYPHLTHENSCNNCTHKKNPNYILGSAFCTIIVGSLVFLTALSWNDVAELKFKHDKCGNRDFEAALTFALILTFSAILVIFLTMYYIPGTKW